MFGGAPASDGGAPTPLWRLDTSVAPPPPSNQEEMMPTPTQASYTAQQQPSLLYRYEMPRPPASAVPSANASSADVDYDGCYGSLSAPATSHPASLQLGYPFVDPLAVGGGALCGPASAPPILHQGASYGSAYQYPYDHQASPRSASPFGSVYDSFQQLGIDHTRQLPLPPAVASSSGLIAPQESGVEWGVPSPAPSHVSISSSKRFSFSEGSSCSDSEHDQTHSDDDGDGEYVLEDDELESKPVKRGRSASSATSSSISSTSSLSSKGSRKSGTGAKRFVCEFPGCDRAFARRFNLTTHVASTHYHSKPFACTECVKSFSRRHDLGRHLAAVHHTSNSSSSSSATREED